MNRDQLLEKFDREIEKSGIRIKDTDQLKVLDNVFDEVTLLALYKLVHKKKLSEIGGSISTGKEANVFYAMDESRPVALKIYRIQSANFNTMNQYLAGDPRFSSVRGSRKEIIFAWTRKEYANLKRAYEAGLPVPEALHFDRNILIMDFAGEGERAYPQIRLVGLEEPENTYQEILTFIDRLFNEASLVHGDLSEYNILWDGEHPVVIDMGQSVTPDHPRAGAFLMRDIKNINRYFGKYTKVEDEVALFRRIVGEKRLVP